MPPKNTKSSAEILDLDAVFSTLKGESYEEKYIGLMRHLVEQRRMDSDNPIATLAVIKLSVEFDFPLSTARKEKVHEIVHEASTHYELAKLLDQGLEKRGFAFYKALTKKTEESFGERGPLAIMDDITQMIKRADLPGIYSTASQKMTNIQKIHFLLDLIILRVDATPLLSAKFLALVHGLSAEELRGISFAQILIRLLLLKLYHGLPEQCFIPQYFDQATVKAMTRLIIVSAANGFSLDSHRLGFADFIDFTAALMCRFLEVGEEKIAKKDFDEVQRWLRYDSGDSNKLLAVFLAEPGKNDPLGEDRLAWCLLGVISQLQTIYGITESTLGLHIPEVFGLDCRYVEYNTKLKALKGSLETYKTIVERCGGHSTVSNFSQLLQICGAHKMSLDLMATFHKDSHTPEASCTEIFIQIYAHTGLLDFRTAAQLCAMLFGKMPQDWVDFRKASQSGVFNLNACFAIEQTDAHQLAAALLQNALLKIASSQGYQTNMAMCILLVLCREITQQFVKNWHPPVVAAISRALAEKKSLILPGLFDYIRVPYVCKAVSSFEGISSEQARELLIRSGKRLSPSRCIFLLRHLLEKHPEVLQLALDPTVKAEMAAMSDEDRLQIIEIVAGSEGGSSSGRSTPAVIFLEDDDASRSTGIRGSKTPVHFDLAMDGEFMEIDSSETFGTAVNFLPHDATLEAQQTWARQYNEYKSEKLSRGIDDYEDWSDDDMKEAAEEYAIKNRVTVGQSGWLDGIALSKNF
ncbi:unnamed protein product, partial [Mesorhabditis spiculigera]